MDRVTPSGVLVLYQWHSYWRSGHSFLGGSTYEWTMAMRHYCHRSVRILGNDQVCSSTIIIYDITCFVVRVPGGLYALLECCLL